MKEKEFLLKMIEHHEAALVMAKQIPSSSRLSVFAQNIITKQSGEIVQMKKWLKEWFGETPDSKGKMKM